MKAKTYSKGLHCPKTQYVHLVKYVYLQRIEKL